MDNDKLLCSASQAASRLSISRSMFYSMDSDGRLGPRKIILSARCSRWSVKELSEWISAGCKPREKYLSMRAKP